MPPKNQSFTAGDWVRIVADVAIHVGSGTASRRCSVQGRVGKVVETTGLDGVVVFVENDGTPNPSTPWTVSNRDVELYFPVMAEAYESYRDVP